MVRRQTHRLHCFLARIPAGTHLEITIYLYTSGTYAKHQGSVGLFEIAEAVACVKKDICR